MGRVESERERLPGAMPTKTFERHSASTSVARGAMLLLATQPLTWLSSFAAATIMPRYLGAQQLGLLAVITTTVGLVQTAAVLGVPSYLVRHVARHPEEAIQATITALYVVLGMMIIVATATGIVLPEAGILRGHAWLLRLALAGAAITAGVTPIMSLLQGREQHGRYAWFVAASGLALQWAGLGVLIAGGGLTQFVLAGTLAAAVNLAIALWMARLQPGWRPVSTRTVQELVRGGLPLMATEVTLLVRGGIDMILVAALAGSQAAGWLAAAYRVIAIPIFIPTLISTPLLPVLSRSAESTEFQRTLRRSLFAVLLLSLPASGGIFALAPALPRFMHWPAEFARTSSLIMVLAWQQPLVAVDVLLGTALLARGKAGAFMRVVAVAAVFNGGANLLVVPLFVRLTGNGALGASVVEVATELLILAGAVMLLPRTILNREMFVDIAKISVCTALLIVAARAALRWSVPAAVLVGAMTYAASVVALRVIRPAELRGVRGVAQQALARRFNPGSDTQEAGWHA